MIVYYLYIIYTLIISLVSRIWKKANRKKTLTFLLWFGLFFIMALRGETVGNDIIRYLDHFESSKWIDIFETRKETGYMLFLNVLRFLGLGRRGYIVIVSFIISSSFAWFYYRYSRNITLSFLLHLTIGLFSFTMSGIRQSLAISFTLFALHYALKRKLLLYLIFIFIAINFHLSAIIFLPVYLLLKLNFKSYKPILISFLFLVVLILFNQKVFSFATYFAPEKYIDFYLLSEDQTQLNILPVIFMLMLPLSILFFWFWQKKSFHSITEENLLFFKLSVFAAIFAVLALNVSALYRMSLYFTTYTVVLISNVLSDFSIKSNSDVFKVIVIIICIAYFIISTTGGIMKIDNYTFF